MSMVMHAPSFIRLFFGQNSSLVVITAVLRCVIVRDSAVVIMRMFVFVHMPTVNMSMTVTMTMTVTVSMAVRVTIPMSMCVPMTVTVTMIVLMTISVSMTMSMSISVYMTIFVSVDIRIIVNMSWWIRMIVTIVRSRSKIKMFNVTFFIVNGWVLRLFANSIVFRIMTMWKVAVFSWISQPVSVFTVEEPRFVVPFIAVLSICL